jgi:hypothetical protein
MYLLNTPIKNDRRDCAELLPTAMVVATMVPLDSQRVTNI